MKIVIITQARVGSTRLPGKIFKKIGDLTLLDIHLQRLKLSTVFNKIVVATTFETGVEQIIDIAKYNEVDYFQGSTEDVLDRFYNAVKDDKPDFVVRVTSDCPLIDPQLIDEVVNKTISENLDYCSNQLLEEYPDGQDIEVFKFVALEMAWNQAKLISEREHVTPFIKNNSSFKKGNQFISDNFSCDGNFNHIRMTVDDQKDFDAIELLINHLGKNLSWIDYTDYIMNNPETFNNQSTIRNEGYLKSLKND
jgi:spore coat polysaccharide biosynthesis protein SpsF